MASFIEFVVNGIEAAIADFTAIWFVIGFVIFAVGLFILGVATHARLKGIRTQGKILGAVVKTRIKTKTRDGETFEETKRTPYLIYEYTRPDGSLHREISSEGGSFVKGRGTGEIVELLVCPARGYDDVYLANDKSSWVLGLCLCAVGLFLMGLMVSSHGFNSVFWISVVGILVTGLYNMVRKLRLSPAQPKQERPPVKQFDLNDMVPVEDAVSQAYPSHG